MATPDRDIKKVVLKHSSLPARSPENKYYLRYRIALEDGSQVSAWSPKYEVDGRSVLRVTYGNEIVKPAISSDNIYINCGWSIPPGLEGRKFDVMVRWSYTTPAGTMSDWFYDSTVSAGSASIVIPTSGGVKAKFVQVLVQLETTPKVVNENYDAVLFQTDITTTKSILDGGTP